MSKKHPADEAWAAYNELCLLEKEKPWLRLNPYWEAMRDGSYARFQASMEVVE